MEPYRNSGLVPSTDNAPFPRYTFLVYSVRPAFVNTCLLLITVGVKECKDELNKTNSARARKGRVYVTSLSCISAPPSNPVGSTFIYNFENMPEDCRQQFKNTSGICLDKVS